MAILAALFGVLGRFLGRILNMALGWATTLLFGRVRQSKQYLVLGISLGSIVWVIVVLGIFVPSVATFLLALVPRPDLIREEWVRLAMLVAALVLPLLIGAAGYLLLDADQRPRGRGIIVQLLRGYLYAPFLALTIVFLGVIAPVRKARSLLKRWVDAHVPVVVKPGGYEKVADDLEDALDGADLDVGRRRAPRVLEAPSKLLALIGGPSVAALVPDELVVLGKGDLEVFVYPSDIAISGKKDQLARARAAIASRLAFTAAYQTSTRESQAVEDRLERIWSAAHGVASRGKGGTGAPEEEIDRSDGLGAAQGARADGSDRERVAHPDELSADELDRLQSDLDGIDRELAHLDIQYEEWEVLYRLRLHVERDLLERRQRIAAKHRDDERQAVAREAAADALVPGSGATAALRLAVVERAAARTPLARLARLVRRLLA